MSVVFPLSMCAEMPMLRTSVSAARSSSVTPAGSAAKWRHQAGSAPPPLAPPLRQPTAVAVAAAADLQLPMGPAAAPLRPTAVATSAACEPRRPKALRPCLARATAAMRSDGTAAAPTAFRSCELALRAVAGWASPKPPGHSEGQARSCKHMPIGGARF